jgi:hypothetical protein
MERRDRIMQLLRECVEEYGEQTGGAYDLQDDTPLIGPNSPVDSLGLVMIITAFEAKLNETYGAELVLASEKAMSMNRSPFRSLGTLTDYGIELLDEAGVKS